MNLQLEQLQIAVKNDLIKNILPFYLNHAIDLENGGFYGLIQNEAQIDKTHPKGLVYCARMLWTYSAAQMFSPDTEYKIIADIAGNYLFNQFWDAENGGFYWLLNYDGTPLNSQKKVYGHAFVLYALAEYYRAWPNNEVLEKAKTVFTLLENKTRDTENRGYFETYEQNWEMALDKRLSEVDLDSDKSMNTHLHMFEAYANLYRIWKEPLLKQRLKELLEITLDKIVHPKTGHFQLFFTKEWNSESENISFGHDIEGSWLLCEAVEILGDENLLKKAQKMAVKMADAVLSRGIDTDSLLFFEADPEKIIDSDKHWWVQAEAVVGYLNAYELTHAEKYLEAALHCQNTINEKFIDHKNGEWFRRLTREGKLTDDPKVYEWKGPYHNGRACMEIYRRIEKIKGNTYQK